MPLPRIFLLFFLDVARYAFGKHKRGICMTIASNSAEAK